MVHLESFAPFPPAHVAELCFRLDAIPKVVRVLYFRTLGRLLELAEVQVVRGPVLCVLGR